jgi:hypothetical protein
MNLALSRNIAQLDRKRCTNWQQEASGKSSKQRFLVLLRIARTHGAHECLIGDTR